jgi:hypothetical protein
MPVVKNLMIKLVLLLLEIFLLLIFLSFQGSGFDFTAVSQTLSEASESLINILRQAGHGQAAFAALQRAAAPLGSLLLGTDPDLRAAVRQRCATACQALVSGLLLPRILSDGSKQRPAAADLGFGYLTATGEDKRNSLGLLTRLNVSLGLDYRRINGLALLGWRYCVLSGLPKPAEQFSQLYVKAAWGRHTADMGFCFKGLCHKMELLFSFFL